MNEESSIVIYKPYVGDVFAASGTSEALASILDVERHISVLSEADINARGADDACWPEDAKVGEVWANVSSTPDVDDVRQKFESVDAARMTLIAASIERDSVFSFLGTEKALRDTIASDETTPTYSAFLRSGYEKLVGSVEETPDAALPKRVITKVKSTEDMCSLAHPMAPLGLNGSVFIFGVEHDETVDKSRVLLEAGHSAIWWWGLCGAGVRPSLPDSAYIIPFERLGLGKIVKMEPPAAIEPPRKPSVSAKSRSPKL